MRASAVVLGEGSKNTLQNYLAGLAATTTDRANISDRLAKAGMYHPSAVRRYFTLKLIATLAPVAIGGATAVLTAAPWEMCLGGGMLAGSAGALIPSMWLNRRIAARHKLLRKSLPDFLDLMIVCLEGGLSLQDTLRRVTDEVRLVHPELADELSIVQRDVELGATIDQGLRRFATRSGHEGVRTLSTFVREAQRFGTNLSEALRGHADFLRTQREHAAEELAQKASIKILLPTMLLILPAVFVVLVGPAIIQIQRAFSGN
jgi:tight adherence protein C